MPIFTALTGQTQTIPYLDSKKKGKAAAVNRLVMTKFRWDTDPDVIRVWVRRAYDTHLDLAGPEYVCRIEDALFTELVAATTGGVTKITPLAALTFAQQKNLFGTTGSAS